MTYENALKIVAEKYKLGTTLVTGHKAKYFEEAAMLYANSIEKTNLHTESLLIQIDEFLEPLHPIRHSNHYLHLKNIAKGL